MGKNLFEKNDPVLKYLLTLIFLFFSTGSGTPVMAGQITGHTGKKSQLNKILVFSGKSINDSNDKPVTKFEVYLLENFTGKSFLTDFDMPFRKLSKNTMIPQSSKYSNKWFNLIEAGLNNKWIFCNYTDGQGWQIFSIHYDKVKNRISAGKPVKAEADFANCFISKTDDSGEFLITSSGQFAAVDGKVYDSPENVRILSDFLRQTISPRGPVRFFHIDNRAVAGIERSGIFGSIPFRIDIYEREERISSFARFRFIYLNKPEDLPDLKKPNIAENNEKLFADIDSRENLESPSRMVVKSGRYKGSVTGGITGFSMFMEPEWYCPADVSPDGLKLAYFIGEIDSLKERAIYYAGALHWKPMFRNVELLYYLVVWDMRTNTVKPIMNLYDAALWINVTPTSLLWSPAPDSKMISLNLKQKILIINAETGKIIRELLRGEKTDIIRWSPDGSKVGMLTEEGKLYVYDCLKDKLVMVNDDKDCFNFVWVR
ncbi:MAG: WD40 repeat domain-containing protein [Firmicutes bacterium]|nr:WD40 repeat domain-containing protein [Bacillota bacterium]